MQVIQPLIGPRFFFARQFGRSQKSAKHQKNGELIKTKTIGRDLTERRRVEELKKSQKQLRSLSAYLESAREEEKKRIARQIHDELGHALTTLSLDLSWLNSRLSSGRESMDIDSLILRTKTHLYRIEESSESR